MLELTATLTPLHLVYLIGVIVMRRDTPIICILFLFLLGFIATKTVSGGIQTVFNASLYAAKEFMEIIATIALITALSKCLSDLGSDYLMMKPLSRVMHSPYVAWWILGFVMLAFSLFLWPSPSVALVGAIMLPLVIHKGLNPLAAAMAINLFGHGIALSYDFVIQGAPAISASAAGIDTSNILTEGASLFLIMGSVTVISAFLLNRKTMGASVTAIGPDSDNPPAAAAPSSDHTPSPKKSALFIAVFTPVAFLADIDAGFWAQRRGRHQSGLRHSHTDHGIRRLFRFWF